MYKKLSQFFKRWKLYLLILFFTLKNVYAAIDCSFDGTGPPSPSQMICPIWRSINALIIIGIIIFSVVLGWGAIKLSTSLGDPKGFEGARKTWTMAIFGFLIVIFAFFIIAAIGRMIAGNAGSGTTLGSISYLQYITEYYICAFLEYFGIQDSACL